MKCFIKSTIKTAVFVLGLLVMLLILSHLFIPKNNLSEFGMDNVHANGILGEKADSIDVVFIGDSTVYSGIIPMQIYEEQGFTSYNCATSAQYLSYTESSLREVFKNQSPTLVVLDANAIYRKIQFESDISFKIEDSMSVFKYHDRWKSLTSGDLFGEVKYTYTDDFKGYVYRSDCKGTYNKDYMKPTAEVKEIEKLNSRYVKSIKTLCEENGAKFLIISVPNQKCWSYAKHNGISELASSLDVKYLDMNLLNDHINIDWQTDTRDKGDHLNYSGAKKLSAFLGSYLKENYSLPDRRSDSNYKSWNQALDRFKNCL